MMVREKFKRLRDKLQLSIFGCSDCELNFVIKWDLETHEEPNMRSTCIVTTLASNVMK